MPNDQYLGLDDEKEGAAAQGNKRTFAEFDCPGCNANNPSEGFGDGAELLCNYCGTQYLAQVSDEGRLRLREV
ncbi:MAG: hypothetical protein HYZ28_21760 [Myxococcales bacterium]|nr:hypothetical protein [Myxococcales bacterium]